MKKRRLRDVDQWWNAVNFDTSRRVSPEMVSEALWHVFLMTAMEYQVYFRHRIRISDEAKRRNYVQRLAWKVEMQGDLIKTLLREGVLHPLGHQRAAIVKIHKEIAEGQDKPT